MANSSFIKGTIETPVSIARGGTGATSDSAARTALGLGTVATEDTVPTTKGGTGLTTLGTAGQTQVVNSEATALEWGSAGHDGVTDYAANAAAYLTMGTAGSVANFAAVSDAGFKVSIDGTERAISIDFTDLPWNIDFTSDGISSNSLAAQSPTNGPYGVRFSSDGTKMYVRSNEVGNYRIYQYTLSTPWDLTTSSYASKSKDLSPQTTQATDFWFNSSGNRLIVFGGTSGNDYAWRYNLGTAWDISTASYSQVTPQFTQSSNTSGGICSDDGLFLYNFDNSANAIDMYTMSSAFNLPTVSYFGSFGTAGRFGASGAQWSHDGRYFWYITYGPTGFDNYYIYRIALDTPYDLSSRTTYTAVKSAALGDSDCFAFKPDGTKLYSCDTSADVVRQYDAQSDAQDQFDIARATEDAIQALTSGDERVDYDTNHYVITTETSADSAITVLSAPDSGTDVTGTSYYNGATNGVVTDAVWNEGKVALLNDTGRINPGLRHTFYDKVAVYSGNAPTSNTVLDLSAYTGAAEAVVMITVKLTGQPGVNQWQCWFYHKSDNDFISQSTSYSNSGSNCATFYGNTSSDQAVQIIARTDSSGRVYWRGNSATGVDLFIEAVL